MTFSQTGIFCFHGLCDENGKAFSQARQVQVVMTFSEDNPKGLRRLKDDFGLTETEWEVLGQLMDGSSLATIGRERQVSMNTVRSHLRNLFQKTDTTRQGELIAVAYRRLIANSEN